jgi:TolB-like protein/class 3 adenylate cyclase/Tfp pilus assembly protein PilF
MADEGFKRKLAAILSADVEGYSRLMDDDEEATVRTLTSYRSAITDLVQQYRGRVVDSPGDNILAEFASVVDSVNCAVEIQRDLAERNAELPDNRKMQFRIGVNLGDVIEEDGRIYGDGVNIAARVESLSEAGGICISGRAHDQVENKLGLEYEDLGKHEVKNISRPIQVYRVLSYPGAAAHRVVQAKETFGRRWRKIGFSAAAIVIVAVALGVWQYYMRRPVVEPASVEKMAYPLPDKPSIAVLPFDNMSGDPQQEYFSDGLSEEIITALSSVPELFVIARNSTFTYKGKPVKVQQISEELGVQYVLEGSVRKSGEKVRITAQLIDALKGHHLWAESYDRKIEDIFVVQEEITMKIINELRVELLGKEDFRLDAPCSENLKAFLKYLAARGQFRRMNKEGNDATRRLTEEAIAIDPGYACAYSLLAGTYYADVRMGTAKSPKQAIIKTKEMAERAISLNPSLGGPHAMLSRVFIMTGQHDKAIATAMKAVDLHPNGILGLTAMGIALRSAGRSEESIPFLEQAVRIDPYSGIALYSLGLSYFLVGQYEEAIQTSKKALDINPNNYLAYLCLASTYSAAGKDDEAQAAVEEIRRISPKLTLKYLSKITPLKSADKELFINNLRNAGLYDTPPLPLPDKPSIAVLAFDNLSGDPEQEYFSDGIAENIITALSKVGELFVIARNSSFTYKGKPVKVQQVGRELGVRYVLEGSVQKSGDRVRITAQLIDAKNGQHVWAERYDREMKDIFAVQDDITKRVVSSLQANLTVGEITRAYASGTNSLEAYLKVIKARNIHMRFTKDDNLISRDMTKEAISIDPEYGEAYVLLAATYMVEAIFGGNKSREELMGQAIGYAKKAVELGTVGGHGMLGNLYSLIGQIDKALTECKLAVDLAPNSASALTWYGAVLIKAGQYDMAVEQLEQAGRRDPMAGTWFLRYLGSAYSLKGRHDEAISILKKAIQKAPKDYLSRLLLTRAYVFAGRPDEAQAEAAEVLRLNPKFSLEKYAKRYKGKDKDLTIDAFRQAGLK